MMGRFNAKSYDMKINVKKTKTTVVSRHSATKVNIIIDGQRLKHVTSFRYLEALISEDGRCIQDVKGRIGMGKEAFNRRKELLTKNLDLRIRKRMVKALVWPVVLYGCETWTMRKEEMDKLKAFEMWVWRKMSKGKLIK